MRFKDKVVIVTGGASGIGKEIASSFSKEGANVVLFDINEELLSQSVEELSKYSKVMGMRVDVSNFEDVEKNVNKVIDKFGRIDILVNNAGITKDKIILRLSYDDWQKVLKINLDGVFNCIKATVKFMVRQHYGRVINISSVIGITGNAGQVNYSASKSGIIGITKSLAKELGSRNITFNAVAPGYIDTPMTRILDEKVKEDILKRIPLGRFGQPEDVAKCVCFLASSDADYINGQVLVVDGGLT
ncbi:MAG: 3-oxoacyl-[acyl-carrier-protein] reductase [Candidatus Omnitrophica bacterium]|nr:3-oxoacyl-[acyl-carrier-protein] reductase [Candidatus Omnitrophota bacterium]